MSEKVPKSINFQLLNIINASKIMFWLIHVPEFTAARQRRFERPRENG